MAEPHVISALTKKRSELLGDIKHYESIIVSLKDNLSTINKTIHIFDENYNLASVKAKQLSKNRYFDGGEAKILILDLLRTYTKPLKTDEITQYLSDIKSISIDSDYERRTFQKSVVGALDRLQKDNLVERAGRDGLIMIWQIKQRVS